MLTTHDKEIEALWDSLGGLAKSAIMEAGLAAKELATYPERQRWLKIGKGFANVRAEALRLADTNNIQHPTYRQYHASILSKVPDLKALEEHDHKSCQHALWLYNNWESVESYLAKLTIEENNKLNHPSSIKRRFDAANKPLPQGLEKPPTVMARKDARIAELEQEVRELHVSGPAVVVSQPRGKVIAEMAHLLRNAETQWEYYHGSTSLTDYQKQDCWESAYEDSEALAELLHQQYPHTAKEVAENLSRKNYEADDLELVEEVERIVDDFAEFKDRSVVLGCLLFLCDHQAGKMGEIPEHHTDRLGKLIEAHFNRNKSFAKIIFQAMSLYSSDGFVEPWGATIGMDEASPEVKEWVKELFGRTTTAATAMIFKDRHWKPEWGTKAEPQDVEAENKPEEGA